MRVAVRTLVLVCVVVVAVASLSPAVGRSSGIFGRAKQGCGGTGCHVGGPADVTVGVDVPDAWTPDRSYVVNVSVSGSTPSVPMPENRGGFNLLVSDGSLAKPNGSDAVQIRQEGENAGREATHTTAGNDQREWSLVWNAPANGTGNVTVWLAVNAVNGNGQQDIADEWTTTETTIPYQGNETDDEPIPEPENVPGPGPVAAVVALAGVAVAVRAATSRGRS